MKLLHCFSLALLLLPAAMGQQGELTISVVNMNPSHPMWRFHADQKPFIRFSSNSNVSCLHSNPRME